MTLAHRAAPGVVGAGTRRADASATAVAYLFDDEKPAVRVPTGLGEFYDVQGTTWSDPPLLSDSSQTVQMGSRSYSLFYTGEEIRVIAWHEQGATYWIQNTLTDSIQPREMVAMAEQTLPVISPGADGGHVSAATPSLRDFKLPPREPVGSSLTSPAVKPIRPQIQSAVGQHDEIVVIFD